MTKSSRGQVVPHPRPRGQRRLGMGLRAELKSVDVTSPIMARRAVVLVVLLVCASLLPALADKGAKKKSISDYSDVDVERIFQEWEVRDHLRMRLVSGPTSTLLLGGGRKT